MSVQLHTEKGVGSGGVTVEPAVQTVAGQQPARLDSGQITGPEPVEQTSKRPDTTTTTLIQFNKLARDLVAKTKTVPPTASRMYALLSMAQLAALEAAQGKSGV